MERCSSNGTKNKKRRPPAIGEGNAISPGPSKVGSLIVGDPEAEGIKSIINRGTTDATPG